MPLLFSAAQAAGHHDIADFAIIFAAAAALRRCHADIFFIAAFRCHYCQRHYYAIAAFSRRQMTPLASLDAPIRRRHYDALTIIYAAPLPLAFHRYRFRYAERR
jgi:hypothetical protein